MNVADVATRQWNISARLHGEVLTAGARSASCELLLLGVPSGYTASEVEGWLNDLIGVARETSRDDTGPRPIPALLHHAIAGLLFSHSEVWNRAEGSRPCTLAFVHGDREVGFGWIGEAVAEVWLDGQRADIEWVRVRDDSGSEARAFGIDATHRVRVCLTCVPYPHDAQGPAATIVAEWPDEREELEAPSRADAASPPAAHGTIVPDPRSAEPVAIAPAGGIAAAPAVVAANESISRDAVTFPESPAGEEERMRESAARDTSAALARLSGASPAPPAVDPVADLSAEFDAPDSPEADVEHVRRRSVFRAWIERVWPWNRERREPRGIPSGDLEAREPESAPAPEGMPGEPGATPTDLPDLIPPTPEPLALAELAADWREAETDPAASRARPVLRVPLEPLGPQVELHPRMIGESVAPPTPIAREPRAPAAQPPAPSQGPPRSTAEISIAPAFAQGPAPVAPPAPIRAPAETSGAAEAAFSAAPDAASDPRAGDAEAVPPAARPPRRPAWPSASEIDLERPLWKKPWAWLVLFVALFAGGWLVGSLQESRDDSDPRRHSLLHALRALGVGGARYEVTVNSRPQGAWIAADGKDLARRTPATIDLAPGAHRLTLSFSDLGSAGFDVRGERGDQVVLDAPLWGSLSVHSADAALPIAVTLDGQSIGFAPVTADSVMPGPHELRFSGPGMPSWGETVPVRVGEAAEVIARPMTSPATGVLEVRATLPDESGTQDLTGATVWIDGEKRGLTPLPLELPRGPHSVRVEYRGEGAPVQVIDLPGGNQRFATFELGLDLDRPSLSALAPPARIPLDAPVVLSGSLEGVSGTEVREMWLHVKAPDGPWRRYQMVMLKAETGVVGVAMFPPGMFDEHGLVRYYVSASIQTGDEYFTEVLTAQMAAPPASAKR